jgi:hypothetical protein
MRPENKNMSDMEYLADLGFEQMGFDEHDLDEITQEVRARAFQGGRGFYFVYISAMVGMFVGVSVFFNFYNAPKIFSVPVTQNEYHVTPSQEDHSEIKLDPVTVAADNFVQHARKPKLVVQEKKNISDAVIMKDTGAFLAALPLPEIKEKPLEQKIHYSPNSPIVFIHDYKITDYQRLYFNRNKLVSLSQGSNVPVLYASREDMAANPNFLDQRSTYFLHEALSNALLSFKRKNYNRCISLLNQVGSYTDFDVNCRFYSGMCYYYKKNYSEAIKNFDACIINVNNVFLPEAEYYKALSLYESGNKEEAVLLFKKIADEDGFYSGKAKEYLK